MTSARERIDPAPDLDMSMRYEAVFELARLGQSGFVISLLNAGIVYYVLQLQVEGLTLAYWLSAIIFLTLVRTLHIYRFWRIPPSADVRSWLWFYHLLIFSSGLCWGSLPLFEVFSTSTLAQAFIVFVVAGMSAGGLVSFYPVRTAAMPYLFIVLTPLITVLALGDDVSNQGMAVLGVLYLLMLLRSAFLLNRNVKKTIRVELENRELFNFLSQAQQSRNLDGPGARHTDKASAPANRNNQ